ncbi:MAG: hypothetical protein JW769_03100 [Parachlamydiales bacterium]|nr:hypothetical protein [Parachlamydiales bacterium]
MSFITKLPFSEIDQNINRIALENSQKYYDKFHNLAEPSISLELAGEFLAYQVVRSVARGLVLAYRILNTLYVGYQACIGAKTVQDVVRQIEVTGMTYARIRMEMLFVGAAILSPIAMCFSKSFGWEGYQRISRWDLKIDRWENDCIAASASRNL